MAPEYTFNQAEVEAYAQDRTGTMVARKLMQRFGWKVGDRITIKGTFFPFDLEMVIRGSYTGPDENGMWFHFDYLNEMTKRYMPGHADKSGSFWIKVRSVDDVPRVSAAIDDMFRNSEAPTKTETEKAFTLSFTSMLGNVRIFLAAIAAAVVFAILLVTMNTMAMSVRERSAEIAVLKTLRFRRRRVLALLVGESVLISLVGAAFGLTGAKGMWGALDMYKMTGGIIQHFTIQGTSMAWGLAVAILVGVLSAAIPAWRTVNSSIASALRHVG